MPLPRQVLLVVTTFTLVAATACSDGNPLREPGTNGATDTTIVVSAEPQPLFDDSDPSSFELASHAFEHEGTIPPAYSRRDGDNVSPPLAWKGVPAETVELALVMTDPNASGFVHWVIWGIDPFSPGLDTGQVPAEALQATNDFGDIGYAGPAPPDGEPAHLYLFRLFALGESAVDVEAGLDGYETIQLLEAKAIAIAELFAFYG
ncbi:MAG: YbhB/YbcL family Raf kinase inhibitor-like protein [Actinomycetia bacterium]|nr:YbhB/YbcL family Raf kinase inhibitor-like protein [Actinomycetes bacterium]MCP4959384.1 YbhB/YbcL family Raf kinase inhibitor-like protein [Actinomycetes bacterium]